MKSENPPPVRLTPQQRRILDILKESGGHLDADTLYRKAKDRNSRISLATVYRTLALFRDAKMIREHRLGGSHAHSNRRKTPFTTTVPVWNADA